MANSAKGPGIVEHSHEWRRLKDAHLLRLLAKGFTTREASAMAAQNAAMGLAVPADDTPIIITIKREPKPLTSRPGPQARWLYSYRVGDGVWITYGTSLGSLRDMLRDKWSPAGRVMEDWKRSKPPTSAGRDQR